MSRSGTPDIAGPVKGPTYAGLFIVTLVTLMHEILLTRIFSVAMWYHYAFLAISVALFGMTVGAILVYLYPNFFTEERTHDHLALSAWLFGVSIVLSFLTFASIPFSTSRSVVVVYSTIFTYATLSVPFVFSGICVALALTRFSRYVGRLYATDLAGAACGCLMVILTLKVTDGPGAVLVAALLAAVGAVFFSYGGAGRLKWTALISSLLLALFAAGQAYSVAKQFPVLRLVWLKGQFEARPLYEKWNSFSRVSIFGNPNEPRAPLGWGLSATVPQTAVRQLMLQIDYSAATVLTSLDGGLDSLQYLKYDVTNLVHYLRRDANMLVIGAGGGRDVLSALLFGQKSIVAVELNQDIIRGINRRFGDFTGHLDRDPRVTFVNDEARSYIARQRARFDIIQASLIDTWAATAAGAFALSENSLYTVEGWKLFLNRLTDKGVLTFSRWYRPKRPTEMYRLTALAGASLKLAGVQNPRRHVMIVRYLQKPGGDDVPEGVGTILVSKQPFSDQEVDTIERVAREMQFDLVLSPRFSLNSTFAALVSGGRELDKAVAEFPMNIAAPTDNSPFFFQVMRLQDTAKRLLPHMLRQSHGVESKDYDPTMFILVMLLFTVLALTSLCIILPLVLATRKTTLLGSGPLFVFFASIGFGFMFVEISQMQRLIIFLGHPMYSLSVVLFALLLSGGVGSHLTQRMNQSGLALAAGLRLGLLLCAIVLFGTLTPYAVDAFQGASTPLRILVAIVILFPLGVLMGMAFPMGMRVASTGFRALTPWLWGLNGATSVCASVLATVLSLTAGVSASFWTGFGWYVIASAALIWATQSAQIGRLDARIDLGQERPAAMAIFRGSRSRVNA